MNSNQKWAIGTVACVLIAVAGTWFFARKSPATIPQPGQSDDAVTVVLAYSKSLMAYANQTDPESVARDLFQTEVKTASGKRIKIQQIGMSSREIVDGILNGTLKAHVIVPSSDVFLDLGDRESKLRTGKPLVSEKVTFMQQPHVLAVRRPMAEAMGWPKKDIGWADVVDVAKNGWKSVGHPEWGNLKLVVSNPNLSDSGVHTVASALFAAAGKSKGMSETDLQTPAVKDAIKALHGAVVWYPASIEEFIRNEGMGVPPQCHITCLPEHHMSTLNERSMRRKQPAEWVAIYPSTGTIVDNVTAAVVQRDWVSDEMREAAKASIKLLTNPEVQKRLLKTGHRPVVASLPVADHLTEAMGVDPKLPREKIDLPDVDSLIDCVNAWSNEWRARDAGSASPPPITKTSTTSDAPLGLKNFTTLSPTVQCVRRARPAAITIRDVGTQKVKGSGVIVDPRGYAVTNYHVVGKDKQVGVTFLAAEDRFFTGDVVWSDPNQDLAIVRLTTSGTYPAIKFGVAGDREIGETVIAIGNPLGYTGTVTVGIVSAMGREITLPNTGAVLTKLIQTDAGINPGNSGGPLLDIEGQLVGIVFAMRDGAQNIAFAIPVDRVRDAIRANIPE